MAILDANYYVKEEPIVFMSPSELDNRYQAKKKLCINLPWNN